jgi:hypothetical protein
MNERSIIDLASRFDGYLAPICPEIVRLSEAGLITTQYAGDGYVIARAVLTPKPRREGYRSSRMQWKRPVEMSAGAS